MKQSICRMTRVCLSEFHCGENERLVENVQVEWKTLGQKWWSKIWSHLPKSPGSPDWMENMSLVGRPKQNITKPCSTRVIEQKVTRTLNLDVPKYHRCFWLLPSAWGLVCTRFAARRFGSRTWWNDLTGILILHRPAPSIKGTTLKREVLTKVKGPH